MILNIVLNLHVHSYCTMHDISRVDSFRQVSMSVADVSFSFVTFKLLLVSTFSMYWSLSLKEIV